jgi:hypothetical protein
MFYVYKMDNDRSQEKFAIFIHSNTHAAYNKTFKATLPIMGNERNYRMMAYVFKNNHMLLLSLNKLLSQMFTSGIAKHLDNYDKWFLFRPFDYEDPDERRILSLTDLEYGFVLWLAACLVSFLCFICELSLKVKRELKILIELIDFLRVLRARMNNYHDTW